MITGLQAAGKTTIGPLVAARLTPPAATFDGDVFYRMVTVGNVDFTPERRPEAIRQVGLRYQASALVAQHYLDAGFDFVYTDIVVGADVERFMDSIVSADRHLVVLDPQPCAIATRARTRKKGNTYHDWQEAGMSVVDTVASMRTSLLETPRRGLWLDTSEMTEAQTADAILANGMIASRYMP